MNDPEMCEDPMRSSRENWRNKVGTFRVDVNGWVLPVPVDCLKAS